MRINQRHNLVVKQGVSVRDDLTFVNKGAYIQVSKKSTGEKSYLPTLRGLHVMRMFKSGALAAAHTGKLKARYASLKAAEVRMAGPLCVNEDIPVRDDVFDLTKLITQTGRGTNSDPDIDSKIVAAELKLQPFGDEVFVNEA